MCVREVKRFWTFISILKRFFGDFFQYFIAIDYEWQTGNYDKKSFRDDIENNFHFRLATKNSGDDE